MSFFDVLKRDLTEFVTTVKVDAVDVVDAVRKTEGGRTSEAVPDEILKMRAVALASVAEDCEASESKEFETFKKRFDVGSKTAEISQLLEEATSVTQRHAELVPDIVPYEQFWLRYYFRISMLQSARVKLDVGLGDEDEEEDLGWGADQDDEDDAPATNAPTSSAADQAGAANPAGSRTLVGLSAEVALHKSAAHDAESRVKFLERELEECGKTRDVALESAKALGEENGHLVAALEQDRKTGDVAALADLRVSLEKAHARELANLNEAHEAALAALRVSLEKVHAGELANLNETHARAMAIVKSDLEHNAAAELQSEKARAEAELTAMVAKLSAAMLSKKKNLCCETKQLRPSKGGAMAAGMRNVQLCWLRASHLKVKKRWALQL